MLHVICATLILAVALAEMTAIRQLAQQYALAGIPQAAAGTPFQSSR
jgi:hypothetical protein